MMLNKNRKNVILVGISLIVLMGLFPPWISGTYTTSNNNPRFFEESAGGYHFIFAPPAKWVGLKTTWVYRLDYSRLFLQWLLIVAVSGGLIFLFREPQKAP